MFQMMEPRGTASWHMNGSAGFSLVHLLGAFECQRGAFLGVLSLILGPNFMFKALEQASVYGQTNVINTDSLGFPVWRLARSEATP